MNTTHALYPLTFTPYLKPVIWGGTALRPLKGFAPSNEKIGESWEISAVPGHVSVVADGALAGCSLDELMQHYGADLVGPSVFEHFGTHFPLLIKFIDAQDNLSIQVHPDDELARVRHHASGKTEMWYVMDARPGACLYSGFAIPTDTEDYRRRIADRTFMDTLARHEVRRGDVFYLPAGRVHAIGAGCLIAEIQQSSDITYRIYDYDRRDAYGNPRELHTDWAADAIDFTVKQNYRTIYNVHRNEVTELVHCPYFHTRLLDLDVEEWHYHPRLHSGFTIYICVEGNLTLTTDLNEHNPLFLHRGQTVLIPAIARHIILRPQGHCTLLQTGMD